MVNGRIIYMAMMALALMLASCDATIHFYPEEDEPVYGKSKIRLDVDWSAYSKTAPTGMTVICHHTETGQKSHTIDNNTDYVTPYLTPGRHWATVFNLTEPEFSYISFRGFDAVETAEAYAPRQRNSGWYKPTDGDNVYVAAEPEWLAADTIMTDQVEILSDGSTRVIGTLHPKNIIYTLHVTIRTENIGNLRAARAAISGLASGRKLASDTPNGNAETVTHLIESGAWSRSRTSTVPDVGTAKADLRCFGLPGNHLGSPNENMLEFYAMLADGKTVLKYNVPVGHLITEGERPPGRRGDNLDLYLNVTLDPPLPPGGGDDSDFGFDAWVEEWEEEDVPVPFSQKHSQ